MNACGDERQARAADEHTRSFDCAVIGSGLAGLIAANALADRGLSVVVVERRQHAGGRARTAERDGFLLNHGPHALYAAGETAEALDRFDITVDGTTPPLADATGRVGSELGVLPTGPASLLRSRLLGIRGRAELGRLLGRLDRIEPGEWADTSTTAWIESQVRTPAARSLVAALCRLSTYSAALDLLSADAAIVQLQRSTAAGVLYLDGGWQTLVDGLVARATRLDVVMRTADVRTVRVAPGAVTITTDDEPIEARAVVVATGSARRADQLLGTRLADAAGPPVEASTLDLGLRRPPRVPIVVGVDTPHYLSTHAPVAALAPPGATLICLARYLLPNEQIDRHMVEAELRQLAAQAGADRVQETTARFQLRLTVAHGMPLAETGGMAGRPDTAAAGDPAISIAGDWVGPNGLLADAASASALAAADRAAAHVAAVGAMSLL